MNRKKALLLLSGLEMLIIMVITVLFTNGTIPLKLFAALLFVVCTLSGVAVFLIIRKMNP